MERPTPILTPDEFFDPADCPFPPGLETRRQWREAFVARINCLVADRAGARDFNQRVREDPIFGLINAVTAGESGQ